MAPAEPLAENAVHLAQIMLRQQSVLSPSADMGQLRLAPPPLIIISTSGQLQLNIFVCFNSFSQLNQLYMYTHSNLQIYSWNIHIYSFYRSILNE